VLLRRTSLLFAIFGVLAALILSIATLQAQEGNDSGNALQISPTRTEISAAGGEQKKFSLTLKNITKGDLSLKAILNDFESDGSTGTPKIVVDTKNRTPYSLDKMLQGLSDLTLKAGESKELSFTLDVPTDVAPGAYFGAIRYQVVPNRSTDEDRQVALNASVAHLVFLEIPGEINEQIQLESLNFQREGKTKSFFLNAPDHASLAVKNLGNGFARPFGRVTLSSWGQEVHGYDVNTSNPKGIVLPNSSRTFVDEVKNIKKPGKYTAVAGVAYGSGAEVITYKSSFWYIPLWCLLVILAVLLAVAGGAYYIYRKKYGKPANVKRRK
jgi:hypothetical protein